MKTAYTPQPSYKRSITEDAERDSHFITRTVIRLAARCAIACLSLSKRLRGPISTPVPNVQSSMATATLDHQEKCQCNSCKCELLVTDLRTTYLFANGPSRLDNPKEWRQSNAVREPFTPTEMKLLDSKDLEYIEEVYPSLAPIMAQEIVVRRINGSSSQEQCPRGLFCDAATFH